MNVTNTPEEKTWKQENHILLASPSIILIPVKDINYEKIDLGYSTGNASKNDAPEEQASVKNMTGHFNFLCWIGVWHKSFYGLIETNSSSINTKEDEKVSHWLDIDIPIIACSSYYVIVAQLDRVNHKVLEDRREREPEHPAELGTEFIRSILHWWG